MKFKVIALAALMGISGMAAQANELPDGPHIVTSGTASVDAVPDIATLAIEVNVAAKDAATAKKQADERVAQYISFLELNQIDPEIFKILPASIYVLVENPICAGGLTAILLNIILPGGYRQENVLPGITSAEEMD